MDSKYIFVTVRYLVRNTQYHVRIVKKTMNLIIKHTDDNTFYIFVKTLAETKAKTLLYK